MEMKIFLKRNILPSHHSKKSLGNNGSQGKISEGGPFLFLSTPGPLGPSFFDLFLSFSSFSRSTGIFYISLGSFFLRKFLPTSLASSSHLLNSPCEKYVKEKSSGLYLANHSILVNLSIRDEKGLVLRIGELFSSPSKKYPSYLLDPFCKYNAQKGEQWWIPSIKSVFLNPLSLGSMVYVSSYLQNITEKILG